MTFDTFLKLALVTSDYQKDQMINREKVERPFYPLQVYGVIFLDAQVQLTLLSVVPTDRNSNSSKI